MGQPRHEGISHDYHYERKDAQLQDLYSQNNLDRDVDMGEEYSGNTKDLLGNYLIAAYTQKLLYEEKRTHTMKRSSSHSITSNPVVNFSVSQKGGGAVV